MKAFGTRDNGKKPSRWGWSTLWVFLNDFHFSLIPPFVLNFLFPPFHPVLRRSQCTSWLVRATYFFPPFPCLFSFVFPQRFKAAMSETAICARGYMSFLAMARLGTRDVAIRGGKFSGWQIGKDAGGATFRLWQLSCLLRVFFVFPPSLPLSTTSLIPRLFFLATFFVHV